MVPEPDARGVDLDEEFWWLIVERVFDIEATELDFDETELTIGAETLVVEDEIGWVNVGTEAEIVTEDARIIGLEEVMVRGHIVVDIETICVVIRVLVAGQLVTLGWQEMKVWTSVL
jgi:cytosine/adenosine deaminase-related metal-dependent hydrolase